MFYMTVKDDNAAFRDMNGEDYDPTELARILRVVADQVETETPTRRGIYDHNGNKVGTWMLQEEDNYELTRAEICDGTGFAREARFVQVAP